MKEKKVCKIIQDLLPNYIEQLTNEETNIYVREHLENCEECNQILNDMEKNISLNNKIDKNEVKYIKKFSYKMKCLTLVILIILAILVINISRKVIILSELENKANEYVQSTNIRNIVYAYQQDTYTKTEKLTLNDKKAIIITKIEDGNKTITRMYENGDNVNIYTETEDRKTVRLNQKMEISTNIYNSLTTENYIQLLVSAVSATIKSTEYNGTECYYIANCSNPYMLSESGVYVEKSTGLVLRSIVEEGLWDENVAPAVDYIYEFNTLTEQDFIEPNIEEYEIL